MEDLIPLFGIFCIFGLPVLGWIMVRAMQHRERIEMIRHGVVPPAGAHWKEWSQPPQGAPRATVQPVAQDDPQCTLRRGIVLAFVGFAITIGLSFIGYDAGPPSRFHPGPWLLGGLIPMFVGIAQVVSAMLFGATFPAAQRGRYGPGQAAMPPPPPPTFEGAYTYRPDPSTQELGRSSPPERR